MKVPCMGALVHAIRKLKGQFEDREAPASSQLQSCTASLLQAPVSRAERVAEQLEGSTLWHDYTASTDDEAFLGQGGQASAIRVRHNREEKDYALKVFTKGPRGLESQSSEVAALCHLQAVPNIVRYREHGEHQGQAWLVETLAEGWPAFEHPREALSMMVIKIITFRVCQTLAEMHGRLRTHADIKPDNIHVAIKQWWADTVVTVLDFGLCQFHPYGTRRVQQLWEGTLTYAPPELFKFWPLALCGFEVPAYPYAADAWGIGMLVVELLALAAELPIPVGGQDPGVIKCARAVKAALRSWARFHPQAAVESDEGAPDFWTICPDPWYRHFIHGALHPDPSERMSPAEMCLHPFLEPAMRAVVPATKQEEWRCSMHQKRLRSPAAKSRGPEARLVVESSLKHLHARMLAQITPKLRAKHAAKMSSRRYKVSPDLCQDWGAVQAAMKAYHPHLVRCTTPTAAAAGHPVQAAPVTAAVASPHIPSPGQDARVPPGLQSERGSLDEPSPAAAAGHAPGQQQSTLSSSARASLDSHFDATADLPPAAAAVGAAGRQQQAPLDPTEPESATPSPASPAGSSSRHGTSQLEVQPKSPWPTAPVSSSPAVLTNGAAQAQAETLAVTDSPAECNAGGQAAACPPGPEPGTSQRKKGRARRWLEKKAEKPLRLYRRGRDAGRRFCCLADMARVLDD